MIFVSHPETQEWRVSVPVEDGEINIKISPEGLVIDFVDIEGGEFEQSWRTWDDLAESARRPWFPADPPSAARDEYRFWKELSEIMYAYPQTALNIAQMRMDDTRPDDA
jgi:hypothetical protein